MLAAGFDLAHETPSSTLFCAPLPGAVLGTGVSTAAPFAGGGSDRNPKISIAETGSGTVLAENVHPLYFFFQQPCLEYLPTLTAGRIRIFG